MKKVTERDGVKIFNIKVGDKSYAYCTPSPSGWGLQLKVKEAQRKVFMSHRAGKGYDEEEFNAWCQENMFGYEFQLKSLEVITSPVGESPEIRIIFDRADPADVGEIWSFFTKSGNTKSDTPNSSEENSRKEPNS